MSDIPGKGGTIFELTFDKDWYMFEFEQLRELEAKILGYLHNLPLELQEEYKDYMGITTARNGKI